MDVSFIVVCVMFVLFFILILASKWQLNNKNKRIYDLEIENQKVLSQRKSSEVRLGKMAEQFAPMIKGYPYDPNRFRFLGDPIDGIQYTDDAVIIIEFKTGKARLTKSQQHVKKLVSEGKVRFETFRINEEGGKIKVEADVSKSKKQNQKN